MIRQTHRRFTLKQQCIELLIGRLCIATALLLACNTTQAADNTLYNQVTYKVAIIIDDLGNNLAKGRALIDMPYQLTYSILPNRPYSKRLANLAASSGKEVMVHIPMQSARQNTLGEGALTLDLTQKEFFHSVNLSIDSVPHARGVNNHMGSLLTRHPGHMAWLMKVLSKRPDNLYFVDSKTTAQTVASKIANEHYIPNITRDLFIDNSRDESDIDRQLNSLIKIAKKRGYAVAIGHPYTATIKMLRYYLPTLLEHNIEIVPVTSLIKLNRQQQQWANLLPKYHN